MSWGVKVSSRVARELSRLDTVSRRRIEDTIESLSVNPRPPGKQVKALATAGTNAYRIRVGDYRVIYAVIDERKLVMVEGVVHRRDLQRWFRNR